MRDDAPEYVVGLDLGQAADYTALAVAERRMVPTGEFTRRGRPLTEAHYAVRHLQRFPLGTSYPTIVEEVARMVAAPELQPEPVLIVDATGVGAPVLDLLDGRIRSTVVVGVTITGGMDVSYEGSHYRVPKRDLVSAVNVLLQSKRLRFAGGLPEAAILRQELQQFRVRITATAHDTFGVWGEGALDDLVLAVALACWYGEHAYVSAILF